MSRYFLGFKLRMKSEIASMPKDLIAYDEIKRYIDETREEGLPIFRKKKEHKEQLNKSKIFGLFLTILLMTGQRNSTVRLMKFDAIKKNLDVNYEEYIL
jgi:hypothetical protein